jgi:predicted MPP superfamily phosphohydrolase
MGGGGGGLGRGRRGAYLPPPLLLSLLLLAVAGAAAGKEKEKGAFGKLRFRRESGTFKVVQVADMHYADGRTTGCEDVLPSQVAGCTDLNTTAFLYRVFRAEDPDLVVFTGRSCLSDPVHKLLVN